MAQVQLFKSIFDNYLDRFDSAAKREVDFAVAIDNARKNRAMVDIYNSQEQRALSQENRLMNSYNRETPSVLAGLSLNKNSYVAQEKRLIDTIQGQADSNQATNIMAGRQLRDQQIKEAIGKEDWETVKRLTGAKNVARMNNGAVGVSYADGEPLRTWESGITADEVAIMQGTSAYNKIADFNASKKSAMPEPPTGTSTTNSNTTTTTATTPSTNGSVLPNKNPTSPTAAGDAINERYKSKNERTQEILKMRAMSADPNGSMPWAVRKLVDFGQGVDSFFGASQPAPSVLAPTETFAKRPMLSQEPTAFDLAVMGEGQAKARGLLRQWLAYHGRTK